MKQEYPETLEETFAPKLQIPAFKLPPVEKMGEYFKSCEDSLRQIAESLKPPCEACARYEERVGPGEKCLEHQEPIKGWRSSHAVEPFGMRGTAIGSIKDNPMPLEPHERAARRFQQVALSYRAGRGMAGR